jgi:hypothetical protein
MANNVGVRVPVGVVSLPAKQIYETLKRLSTLEEQVVELTARLNQLEAALKR